MVSLEFQDSPFPSSVSGGLVKSQLALERRHCGVAECLQSVPGMEKGQREAAVAFGLSAAEGAEELGVKGAC